MKANKKQQNKNEKLLLTLQCDTLRANVKKIWENKSFGAVHLRCPRLEGGSGFQTISTGGGQKNAIFKIT